MASGMDHLFTHLGYMKRQEMKAIIALHGVPTHLVEQHVQRALHEAQRSASIAAQFQTHGMGDGCGPGGNGPGGC